MLSEGFFRQKAVNNNLLPRINDHGRVIVQLNKIGEVTQKALCIYLMDLHCVTLISDSRMKRDHHTCRSKFQVIHNANA